MSCRNVLIASTCLLTAFSLVACAADESSLEKEVLDTMKKATLFYRNEVSTQGGYLSKYTADLKYRYGEMPARESQIWVQDPGTVGVANTYLDAFEATGDPLFFEAADAAVRALIRGQLECGGWNYLIDFKAGSIEDWYEKEGHHPDYNEFYHYYGNATFDDGATYGPTVLLLRIYDMTQDPVYLGPLEKALDFVLEAQFPIGAWPQRYPLVGTSYNIYYTFNDDVISNNINLMFEANKILLKPKYLESARRGADFIIASQQAGPQYGWGQQIGYDMKPIKGRNIEPKGLASGTTIANCRTLMDVYELTGDRRYLEPVPRSLDWLDSIINSDGSIGTFIEEGTNRFLAAKYVGDSGSYESIETTYNISEAMGGYGYLRKNFSTKRERERYNRLASTSWQGPPPDKPSPPSSSDATKRAKSLEKNVRQIIDALDDRGRWTADGRMNTKRYCYKNVVEYEGPVMKNGWIRTRTFTRNIDTLSNYLALLKITRQNQ